MPIQNGLGAYILARRWDWAITVGHLLSPHTPTESYRALAATVDIQVCFS